MEIGNSFLLKSMYNTIWQMLPYRMQNLFDIVESKYADEGYISNLMEKGINFPKEKHSADSLVYRDGRKVILNIEGTLVPKASGLDAMCGLVGTVDINNKLEQLIEDPSINSILIYVDSPGGAVTGVYELAETIYNARGNKNIITYTDNMATSAGYFIASAGEKFFSSPTAIIANIGVYLAVRKNLEEEKRYKTYIYNQSDFKLLGHPDIAMTEEEDKILKEKVEFTYNMFVSSVAKYRGLDEQVVRDTKSLYFSAIEDKNLNFVDGFMTANSILKEVL